MRYFFVSYTYTALSQVSVSGNMSFPSKGTHHPSRQAFKDFILQTLKLKSETDIALMGLYEFKNEEDYNSYNQ